MRYTEADLPKTLSYFQVDTGDATHGYAGAIENEYDDKRVREHYPKVRTAKRMLIGHYELVRIEEVPIRGAA
jgi:hypothetical protein